MLRGVGEKCGVRFLLSTITSPGAHLINVVKSP